MTKNFDQQLVKAAAAGDDEEVRRLIPLANTKNNEALKAALHSHCSACVEMLLPVSDLSDPDEIGGMLIYAVESLDAACVKLFIGVCNPKFDNSLALRCAVVRGYTNIVDALFPVSEPRVALEDLQEKIPRRHNRGGVIEDRVAKFQERVERFESEQQNKVLSAEVNSDHNPVKNKQKM